MNSTDRKTEYLISALPIPPKQQNLAPMPLTAALGWHALYNLFPKRYCWLPKTRMFSVCLYRLVLQNTHGQRTSLTSPFSKWFKGYFENVITVPFSRYAFSPRSSRSNYQVCRYTVFLAHVSSQSFHYWNQPEQPRKYFRETAEF